MSGDSQLPINPAPEGVVPLVLKLHSHAHTLPPSRIVKIVTELFTLVDEGMQT